MLGEPKKEFKKHIEEKHINTHFNVKILLKRLTREEIAKKIIKRLQSTWKEGFKDYQNNEKKKDETWTRYEASDSRHKVIQHYFYLNQFKNIFTESIHYVHVRFCRRRY